MRVCVIGKYPPIQGGEASKAYWLFRGLGQRGHNIHVVTNCMEVETEYREALTSHDIEFFQPEGVTVHSTNPFDSPDFVPHTNPYSEKLASYAVEVVSRFELQIIDSWYLVPYSVAAFITKTLTGRPQIIRHAGSDISRLFASPHLQTLLTELLLRADRVVTYPGYKDFFEQLGLTEKALFFNTKVSVDTNAFNPSQPPLDLSRLWPNYRKDVPVVTFLGKYGVAKGILDLLKALEDIEEEFLFVVVTSLSGRDKLRSLLGNGPLAQKTLLVDFMPPWRVPSLFTASTVVVHPERDFPIVQHTPILPREVMASGTCLVLSQELYQKRMSSKIRDKDTVLVVDPKDTDGFRTTLQSIIRNPYLARQIGHRARNVSEEIETFDAYLDSMEMLYQDLVME